MKVFYLNNIPTEWSEECDMLLNYVSEERKKRILAYMFDADKLLSLYAALLVRYGIYLLSDYKDKLTFNSKINHKPYCNELGYCDFSFSHTGNAVLCGITFSGRIGVDIECIKEAPYEIMDMVYADSEIKYINSGTDDKNQRFYEIWTSKEAYTKCIGTGLSTDIKAINMCELLKGNELRVWRIDENMCSVYCENDYEYVFECISCSKIVDYLISKK